MHHWNCNIERKCLEYANLQNLEALQWEFKDFFRDFDERWEFYRNLETKYIPDFIEFYENQPKEKVNYGKRF